MAVSQDIVFPAAAMGYLELEGKRAYFLGGHSDLEVPMLDWRTAPLAEAFFRPGEHFSVELGERVLEGRVVARVLRHPSPHHPAPVRAPRPDRSVLPTLDAEQQRAVDLPRETSLVVDGEAGVGKTLVALYRLAALKPKHALVLVPTEGLRRLTRLIADRLGVSPEIRVFDDWLLERGRLAFALPEAMSELTPASVIALKRNPAVRTVLDDLPRKKLPRQRLLHLWGDRDRLLRIGASERAITLCMQHTRRQFEDTTEKANRHVDADRLVAVDGRALDAGTPMGDATTFDIEDVPVLFELVRRGRLRRTKLPRYDHIVVDEAQLRAPMELAVVADALDGSITLAGDHRQATDESAHFVGWAAARGEFRAHWAEVTLAITYRSVPAIASFANAMRIPPEPPPDPAVWATRAGDALAQAAQLCWHLDALLTREPWRQICVIARNADHARRLSSELRGIDTTLVVDGDFRFEPGVIVTPVAAVSGLEFDAVVIPDLTPAFYPREFARALYVAATRARDWLWLLTTDEWSPLVLDVPDHESSEHH